MNVEHTHTHTHNFCSNFASAISFQLKSGRRVLLSHQLPSFYGFFFFTTFTYRPFRCPRRRRRLRCHLVPKC